MRSALSSLLLSLLPLMAQAADLLEASERQLKTEEDKARHILDQLKAQPDVLKPARAGERPVLADETPCLTLRRIELDTDAPRFTRYADSLNFVQNRCVGAAGLKQIVDYLNDQLLQSGLVTSRALVPEQNLADGVLRLTIVPGRIADIRFADDENAIWRNAVSLRTGDVLNLRDLEQGTEQLQRLPSYQAKLDIQPGATPGSSDIVINRQSRGGLGGQFMLDNTGSGAFGAIQANLALVYDNPFGLSDQLNLNVGSNLLKLQKQNRSQSLVLGYSVPWGYTLVSPTLSYSAFAQRIQGVTQTFLSHGNSRTAELRAQQVLWRTGADRLSITLASNHRQSHSFIDDTEITVQRRRTSNLELGVAYRGRYEIGTFDLAYTRRKGMTWFGAQDDLASAFVGGVTLRPDVDLLSASYATRFKAGDTPIGFSTRLQAQYAHQPTLVTDQLSIGTLGTVRGYDGKVTLSAERGWYWRNELTTPLWGQQAYLALDAGRVWGPAADTLIGDRLSGASLGLRGQYPQINVDAGFGLPISHPDGFQSRSGTFYLNLAYGF